VHNQTAALTHRPTAQILVRAKSYQTARSKSKDAYNSLDGVFNTTLSGTYYQSVTARQEPTDIGLDDVGRPRIVFNIDAEKNPS
jgi:Bacteriophage minor capsid protein